MLHCLLAYILSEKSALIFIFVLSVYIMSLFPLADFKIFFFVTGFKQFDDVVCWWSFSHDSCACDLLILDQWIYSFKSNLDKFFSSNTSSVLSHFIFDISKHTYFEPCEIFPQLADALFIFFSLFSLSVSFWIFYIAMPSSSLVFSSVAFNLLIPSSES